jgi:hypothetical protein
MRRRTTALACIALLPALALVANTVTPAPPAAELVRAANEFLASLSAEQRAKTVFAFADAERLNWHFIPRERRGLPLKEMSPAQRTLARRLLEAGLGQRGYLKANTIMELELVLREMGGNPTVRDPERYYFSIFGTPGQQPWGWRAEGHHLSLNFTIAHDTIVATAPAFFGANPAEVRTGTRKGLRALAAEEDLARELVTSLDAAQRTAAIIATEAPRDIITGNTAQVDPLSPVGIPITQLRANQSALLLRLLDEYLARMTPELARARRARLEQTDFARVAFAWAGSIERGAPHYYRIQGPTFLIEYDNTQNDANHIHSVWRDFASDFGRDLLREHYRSGVHPH